MIQATYRQWFSVPEKAAAQSSSAQTPTAEPSSESSNFNALFSDVTQSSTASSSNPASATATSLGDPDIQDWLNSYWKQQGDANAANISYEAADGAGTAYQTSTVYGPDAIYQQALENQIGNAFGSLTGDSATDLTSKLPGIPSEQVQQQFDYDLAIENAQRLASGQPIDTSAYWTDPGSIDYNGQVFTAQDLGYAGPGQSSGPEPIYISTANQVPGTNTYNVPGYAGTVTGITPGRYYTLQQLEQAGLKPGQPDGQFNPGSWTTNNTSTTQSS
ncbi:MAG TPA: hypothetical protein VMT86_14755 [Bryobacteraceae bacterium]|nr:hypothetical protein [Bryobacteraceae bacterium]